MKTAVVVAGVVLGVALASCLEPVGEPECVVDEQCIEPARCVAGVCSASVTGGGGGSVTGGGGGSVTGGGGGSVTGGGGGGSVVVHQRVLCSALDATFGSSVQLQNATATHSQSTFGPFTVARAIDGNPEGGFGWAIDGQLSRPHTAAFETAQDTPPQAAGTRLLLRIHHSFLVDHALGRFRFAVTTSPRSMFADGNEGISTPGNVGASSIWTVLTPRRFCISTNGPFVVLPDDSLLAGDTNASSVDYVVEADTNLSGITGVRLEVLTHSSLPANGPGLNNTAGNFVLSEFSVRAGPQSP